MGPIQGPDLFAKHAMHHYVALVAANLRLIVLPRHM
jgi:hypothetical protein